MTKRSVAFGLMLVGMINIGSLGVRVNSTEAESEYSNGTYFVYLPAILNSAPSCDSMPTLISPVDESNLDTLIPLFSIDPGSNPAATAFRFRVSSDSNFNTVIITFRISIINPDPFEIRLFENLNPDSTYYWRAWHVCDDVEGPYTETWSFTTGSGGTILPAPNLITPANGSTLTSLPETFEWTSVSGAIDYVINVSEVGDLGGSTFWDTATQVDIGWLDPDTTYDWWVAARNDYAVGVDSDIWQFTTPSGTLSPFQEDQIQLRIYSDGDGIVIVR
jgi:hypothetical protein